MTIGLDQPGAGALPAAHARVVLTSGFSQHYTNGVRHFDISASTMRGVIKAMDTLYPGLGERLEEETSVVIDGELHELVYAQPVRPGCEIFFLPRIEGG